MTGKRFEFREATLTGMKLPYVYDKSMQDYLNPLMCVDLLNELLEEKEILELQLKSATNEIDKLMDEINILTDTCHDCCKEIREENEQLKHSIKCLEADKMELQQYIKRMQGDVE